MSATEPVVTELTIDASGASRGQEQYARSMDAAQAAMERMMAVNARLAEAFTQQARVTQQVSAANDNLSKSYSSANDNVKAAGDGFRSTIVEVASLTNQLKFVALAAYAASPAFRAMVNPAITASVVALGPAAVSAAGAVVRALTPALAFLSSIALPILAIVSAFVALNRVVELGADLLDKYGRSSRLFDSATAESNLKKLTTFQGGDDVTSQDAQNAADLAARLDQAKFRLQEFMKVQIDLNGYGLAFQRIWVNIVELVASVADTAGKFIDTFIKGLGELKNVITQIGSAIIDALWNNLPAPVQAMLQGHYPTATQSSGGTGGLVGSTATVSPADDASERAAALAAARKTLSAAMGVAAGGTDGANIGSTFAARWNTDIDALANKAKDATDAVTETKTALDRAIESIERQTEAWTAEAQAQGLGVQATEEYKTVANLVSAADRAGIDVTAELGQKFNDLAVAAGAAKNANELAAALDKAQFDAKTALLSPMEKEIALLQKKNGINAQTDEIASLQRTTAAIKQAQDASVAFGTSLANSLLSGRSLTDSLKGALDQLSSSMVSGAFKSLASGDFIAAGIQAVVAVGSKLLGNALDDTAAKQLAEAQANFAKMAGDITKFNAAAAGFTLSPLIDELTSLTQQWVTLGTAAAKAGENGQLAQLQQTFQDGVGRIIDNYLQLNAALSDSGKAIAQAKADADGMADSLHQAGLSMGQAATIAQEGLGTAIAKIKSDLAATLQANINTATGKGYVNDISSLDITRNQLLAEGNADPALIQASFTAQAQKIIDDAGLIGDAFNQLTTQFPDLSGAVQQSASALADQAKAAQDAADANTAAAKQLQDSLNGTAKTVVDYLNGLVSGQNSTLSPQAVLANAQQVYNANLALAQGGNADAEAKFPELAEDLRKAALAVFASGQGFQDIQNQIISQGLALPAVQQTTDPVVIAIRDSIDAINKTTAAVDNAQKSLNLALSTGNLMTIAGALNLYLPSIDTNSDNAISLNEMITALGPTGGNVLTSQQLAALKLATDATAGQALTNAQISALGLSQEQGNVLRVFQELDGNGDGILQKSELIKQATQNSAGTDYSTLANIQETLKYSAAMYAQLATQITQMLASNSTLTAMQGLQATAAQQLDLLNRNLTGSSVTVGTSTSVAGPLGIFTATGQKDDPKAAINNNLLTALNKIVYNTWAIALNTAYMPQGVAAATARFGVYATGGWISGGTPGRDSVPILAMPDEFMVNANATRALTRQFGAGIMETINAGRLPSNVVPFPVSSAPSFAGSAGSDNSAMLAELRRLNSKIERLEATIAGGAANTVKAIHDASDDEIDAIHEGSKRVAFTNSRLSRDNINP